MKHVAVLLPNGYEEMEALTVVDLLRRAGARVEMLSITGQLETVGDHQIRILADRLLEDVDVKSYDLVVTPGGMPGTQMLCASEKTLNFLRQAHAQENTYVASICASPLVLTAAGLSQRHRGCCYPGLEEKVRFAEAQDRILTVDGCLITSQGPATAMVFALKLVELLFGEEKRKTVEEALLWDRLRSQIAENEK